MSIANGNPLVNAGNGAIMNESKSKRDIKTVEQHTGQAVTARPDQEKELPEKGNLHRRSDDFGKVPEELMHDLTLTDGAVRLYAHMHWRYGSNQDNHESHAYTSRKLGVSARTIANRVNELVRADWVVVTHDYNDQGEQTSNIYDVFELQADCRKWRQENGVAKPSFETLPLRKPRTGVGGKPAHKPKAGGTQIQGGQVEPEFNGGLNPSSDNPDSLIQTHSSSSDEEDPRGAGALASDFETSLKDDPIYQRTKVLAATAKLSEPEPATISQQAFGNALEDEPDRCGPPVDHPAPKVKKAAKAKASAKPRKRNHLFDLVMLRSFIADPRKKECIKIYQGRTNGVIGALHASFPKDPNLIPDLRRAYRKHARTRDKDGKLLEPCQSARSVVDLVKRYRRQQVDTTPAQPVMNGWQFKEIDVAPGVTKMEWVQA